MREQINHVISRIAACALEDVAPGKLLFGGLHHSIERDLDLALALETEFSIVIPDEEWALWQTVADVYLSCEQSL